MPPDSPASEGTAVTLRRLAWVCWIAAIGVVSLRVAAAPQQRSVVPIFLDAGTNWMAGAPLYEKSERGLDRFRYSPAAAVAFTTLLPWPEAMSGILWRWLNVAALSVALLAWLHAVFPRPLTPATTSLIFLLVWPFALGSLNNGQVNILLLALMLGGVAAVQHGRFLLAASLVAAACWLKVYPLALGLLLCTVSPWRFGARFALALLLGFALPFVFQRPDYVLQQYRSWFTYLGDDDRTLLCLDLWLRDIRLLFRLYAEPITPRTYLLMQFMAGLVCALWCVIATWILRLPLRRVLFVLTNLAACWMIVFGPSSEPVTMILLGPALATTLVLTYRTPAPLMQQMAAIAAYELIVGCILLGAFSSGRWFSNLGAHPAGGLLLFTSILFRGLNDLRRRARQGSGILDRYRQERLGTRLFLRLRWWFTPYERLARLMPPSGPILDLGSGHGLLSLTLAVRQNRRTVLAIDHDSNRVASARQAATGLSNLNFENANYASWLAQYREPVAGIIILDALHYLTPEEQADVVRHCYALLQPGGTLLVREVDTTAGLASWWNRWYERVLTTIGFTRGGKGLTFRTPVSWMDLFTAAGFVTTSEPCTRFPFADRLFVCMKWAGEVRTRASSALSAEMLGEPSPDASAPRPQSAQGPCNPYNRLRLPS